MNQEIEKGSNPSVMRPVFCAPHLAQFLQKLYLKSGLATTKQQTALFILNEISKRNDFAALKKLLTITIEKEFHYLPTFNDELLELLRAF